METKDLIEVDAKMKAELETVRKQLNIEPDRFYKAVKFCELVLDGTRKTDSYMQAFSVSKATAETTASQFHKSKWVQNLILFLRPNEHTLYFGERKRIIQAGMAIIDDRGASNRDKTEAMKALQPFIKAEMADNEEKDTTENVGETTSQNLSRQIAILASKGLMINDSGDIIEVELIE